MKKLTRFALVIAALFLAFTAVHAHAAQIKQFRGTLGNRTVTMSLRIDGQDVSGSYSYDGLAQRLTLQGRRDAKGAIRLDESDPAGQRTGQFAMEMTVLNPQEERARLDGSWTPPEKSDKSLRVSLTEQDIAFSAPTRIETKTILDRKHHISAAYPQIVGKASPAVGGFNRAVAALIHQHISDFKKIMDTTGGHWYFDADYVVLFGKDDLVSVEIVEDVDVGGAHPSYEYYALTWNLRTGKEIKLSDLFKPKSNYLPAVLSACLYNIDLQASRDESGPARTTDDNGQDRERLDYLKQSFDGKWGLTRQGVVLYFDFPHGMAAYSRAFVPFRKIDSFVKRVGPLSGLLSH